MSDVDAEENGNGDGCAIILDWYEARPDYYCENVDVYGNFITRGLLTVTDEFTLGGINCYRSKDCKIYSNVLHKTRCAFTIDGQTTIADNNTGNQVFNNTVTETLAEAIRLGPGALEVPFKNNIFMSCESISSADGGAVAPDWDYNCYHDSGSATYQGLNDVTENPMLLGSRPMKGSPVLGAGVAQVPNVGDFLGNLFDSPPNMGAFNVTARPIEEPEIA